MSQPRLISAAEQNRDQTDEQSLLFAAEIIIIIIIIYLP